MLFITQAKTNWKFLLLIFILAIIVGGGIFWPRQSVADLNWTESCGEAVKGGCSCVFSGHMGQTCGGFPSCSYTCPARANATVTNSCDYNYSGDCYNGTACGSVLLCLGNFTCIFSSGDCSYTCDASWEDTNSDSVDGCESPVVPCVPDGCNGNCPTGCTIANDPDCGCLNGNNCCGIGCNNTNDNDCPAPPPPPSVCTPDGCNGNCPTGCTVTQDPDCGCLNDNGCCGIGCTNTNDNDCAVAPPVCVPDGCNANCPTGCTVTQDPDCGCLNNNNCCGIGCNNANDNDCPAVSPVCTPNGCNGNCPTGCTVTQDPDCGCLNDNNCCGIGCNNANDNDCVAEPQTLGGVFSWLFYLGFTVIPFFICLLISYLLILLGSKILKIEAISKSKIIVYLVVTLLIGLFTQPLITTIFGNIINKFGLYLIIVLIDFVIILLFLRYYFLLSGKKLWQFLLYLVILNLIFFGLVILLTRLVRLLSR